MRMVKTIGVTMAALCAFVTVAAGIPAQFYPGSEFPGATGSLSQTNDEVALDFDFAGGGAYVMADFPLKPARFAKRATFEVFHAQPCGVSVRYVDSTDQTFQRHFPSGSATGVWTRLSMAFADVKGVGHWLGADDGVAHPPFRCFQVMANNVRERKAKGGPKGTLLIRNLVFEDMSADACAELDRVRAEPETIERVVTDFGRGDVNAFDRLDSVADRARYNKVWGGRFADGTWDLGLADSGTASLERTIPIYGTPVSFTLDVEAPAAAAGLEIGLHIQCNWQHFTNTIGRLVAPPRGVKTIRQTLAVMAPPGPGWGYHGTPNDGKPAAPFMFRELVVRRGSSKAKFVRLKLLSLKACTRVEPPVLRVRPGPDSAEPPKTLLTELHNLSHQTLTGSFVCELTDWEGRSLGTCETPAAVQPGRDAPGTASRETVAVAPGGCSRTAVAVPSVPDGVNAAFFRIAFRDAAGREQGRTATATWTRPLAGSLPAEPRPDLPWGMGLYIDRHYLPNRDYSKMRRVLALARDAGVKWLREGLGGWPRGDGTYDFGIKDVVLDLAAEYGMCVYGVVSGDRKDATIGTDAGRARYCAMLEQTLRLFGSRVKAWEIWNEPNHPYFWPCARAAYGDLLRDAYATVKRVDPAAQVLGFSTAGLDFDFLRLGVTNGVPFDAVTTHPYRGSANEVFFRADLAKVRDAVGGRENWLTEMGWSTWANGVSEHDQASYLARVYLTVAATPGVKNVCWYDFVNDGWNPHYCEENFGILRRDLAPKPGYRALAKVCRTFTEGKATMTALPLDGTEKAGRMAWLFRMGGKSAVWSDTDEKVPLVLTVPEAKVTNLMDEPVAARRTSEGLVVSVDRRHPLFVDADVTAIRRDDQFVQDFEPEAYRPVAGLRWTLPAGATREGDILTVESRTNGTVCASAPFDLSPYCGRGVQFRIRARGEAVSKPPLGYEVTNDLFHKNSWYFRNALVRANYENVRLGVEKTQLPLEEFFKVLLFGENLELKNRYLRIGAEYGTAVATATSDLHRHDEQSDVGANVGVNVGVKLTATEELAVKALLLDSRLSSLRLAETLQISKRQAERVVASLKRKVGLRRRGAAKNGEWYFEGLSEERNVR